MPTEVLPYTEPRASAGQVAKLPALFLPDAKTAERFLGFFTANISNNNTWRAYYKAACRFSDCCESKGLCGLALRPARGCGLAGGVQQGGDLMAAV
jgi:hypothetical protein